MRCSHCRELGFVESPRRLPRCISRLASGSSVVSLERFGRPSLASSPTRRAAAPLIGKLNFADLAGEQINIRWRAATLRPRMPAPAGRQAQTPLDALISNGSPFPWQSSSPIETPNTGPAANPSYRGDRCRRSRRSATLSIQPGARNGQSPDDPARSPRSARPSALSASVVAGNLAHRA